MRKMRGFTLLELIIVVALIGIITAITLVLLGDARAKGSDTAIRSQVTSARSQAELYYHLNNSSYSGVCDATLSDDPQGIADFRTAANAENGGGAETCIDSVDAWAFEVQLVRDNTQYACVSTGGEGGVYTGSTIDVGDYTCGP